MLSDTECICQCSEHQLEADVNHLKHTCLTGFFVLIISIGWFCRSSLPLGNLVFPFRSSSSLRRCDLSCGCRLPRCGLGCSCFFGDCWHSLAVLLLPTITRRSFTVPCTPRRRFVFIDDIAHQWRNDGLCFCRFLHNGGRCGDGWALLCSFILSLNGFQKLFVIWI